MLVKTSSVVARSRSPSSMPPSKIPSLLGRTTSIIGLGCYAPERVITNEELALTLDTSDEWVRQRTGISERHVVPPGESTSDLGIAAAKAALADARLDPCEIDMVITATVTPDQIMPATAARVALEAGCVGAAAFDLSAGCTGFLYSLALAASAVASGLHDNILVVGAEAISKILDWSDRSTAVLFGDGAGAAVVSTARGAGHILGFELGGDGSGGDFLSLPAGGTRMPATHETVDAGMHFVHMDGKEIYKFATRIIAPSAEAVLARCGKTVDDVDLFVPHQANLRIIEAGAKKLGIPMEKVYTNLQRYGNTSSASMPMCLTEARQEGRLHDGDLVLLMGFGGGLTWGSGLLEWGS